MHKPYDWQVDAEISEQLANGEDFATLRELAQQLADRLNLAESACVAAEQLLNLRGEQLGDGLAKRRLYRRLEVWRAAQNT